MPKLLLPTPAVAARLPSRVELSLLSPSPEPPSDDDWLHEVKYDGHRLVAILDGRGGLRLISRNGFDRTAKFRGPFDNVLGRTRHEMVVDGEIAVPDERGVTHIADLQDAIADDRHEALAFFAFDLGAFRRPRSAPLCSGGSQGPAPGRDR